VAVEVTVVALANVTAVPPEEVVEVTVLVVTTGITVVPVVGLEVGVVVAVAAARVDVGFCPDVKVRD
jgi:hypothetical protein